MVELIISGTPQEILTQLEAVKVVADMRNEDGWRLFQSDEEWNYETEKDERVCPVCLSFAGQWVGDQIPVEFNQWKRHHPLRYLEKNEVYPNTHEGSGYDFLWGLRRCVLEWIDYFFTLTRRLWREFEAVTT